ncbi:MAG: energy transducer TonB [Acidobacteriaceae bacterium]
MSRILEKENLPVYPEPALQQHVQGKVTVKVLVDPTGHVATAELVSGDTALANAGVDAARGFQFQPYRLNGEAIYVESQIILEFSIKGHGYKAKGHVAYLK